MRLVLLVMFCADSSLVMKLLLDVCCLLARPADVSALLVTLLLLLVPWTQGLAPSLLLKLLLL